MTTLLEHFERAHPPAVGGPLKDYHRSLFMTGVSVAIREISHAATSIEPDAPDASQQFVTAITSRCMSLTSELATWALLSRSKDRR